MVAALRHLFLSSTQFRLNFRQFQPASLNRAPFHPKLPLARAASRAMAMLAVPLAAAPPARVAPPPPARSTREVRVRKDPMKRTVEDMMRYDFPHFS